MKRVAKTIILMDTVATINDPQCELLLLHSCIGISKLYFSMRTCLPCIFESAQCSFDGALCSSLERIITASGPGFGDWQWMLANLPFAFGGLVSILQMALWKSQTEDHTFDWLRMVPISDLGQTTKGKTYRCVLCHRLDHAISCGGIIGIKHRCNIVRDTYVDICYCSGILSSKEVDIELNRGRDKPLRPADMLLYSWDGGLDVKYMDKCATIGYGFLTFSFSSLGEVEADTVTLLKWIRKFSLTQDKGARAAVHIFNRISFAIAKATGA
ncbi:hypothetical protein Tco_0568127 [Tanacetum coccineum]